MEQLRRLVERYEDQQQLPVRFRPQTWRPWLQPHGAARILDVGTACVSGTPGDRLIARSDLVALPANADQAPDGLRDLFVAVMVWGSGTTNGRGPRYTHAALGDERLPDVLRTTRFLVRDGNLGEAYRRFTVRGVGRSFFTKWLAVVDDRGPECERALILDDRVLRSLNALGWRSWEAAGTRDWATRYTTYVSTVHGWARQLGITADRLEWLLFCFNGRAEGL